MHFHTVLRGDAVNVVVVDYIWRNIRNGDNAVDNCGGSYYRCSVVDPTPMLKLTNRQRKYDKRTARDKC